MNSVITFIKKNKNYITLAYILVLITLLILPICTKNRVKIEDAYYTKEKVALYIYKFNDLPRNFITKSGAQYMGWGNAETISQGYNYGGDTFFYENSIINYTKQSNLKEADIYFDRAERISKNNRGVLRLVFTRNTKHIEVFYTFDHYITFEKITMWNIQKTSNILWIVLAVYLLMTTSTYVFYKEMLIKQDKAINLN